MWIGGSKYDRYYRSLTDEEILGPLPPEPTFEEPLDAVRAQLETMIGKVTVPKSLDDPNPAVAKLLRDDDDKRGKQKARSYYSTYDAPLYDTPPQRRRLRLLSAIFNATANYGARADTWGSPGHDQPENDFVVTVGHQGVRLRAGFPVLKRAGRGVHAGVARERHLSIILEPGDSGHAHGRTWEDGELSLEQQAREIVLAIMLRGEERYRQAAIGTYEWRVKLKADTIERLRKEKEEADRKERERQAELERRRVERLLADADAFRKAREIRNYVDEARTANLAAAEPMAVKEFEAWARWALAQADRLDPVIREAFRITSEEQAG